MSQTKLNWLDKTVWALAKLTGGHMKYNIYLMKAAVAGALFISLLSAYAFCYEVLGIVGTLPQFGEWQTVGLIALLVLCYVPIHLATNSAAEVESADLPKKLRWAYTALGLFIFPISWMMWGVLLGLLG